MPVLSTFRREAFALSVARGATYTRAALNAGFSARTARSQGCELAKNPKVAERIAELRRTEARHPVTIFDDAGTPIGLYVPAA
jgi:phage terminase small subunit